MGSSMRAQLTGGLRHGSASQQLRHPAAPKESPSPNAAQLVAPLQRSSSPLRRRSLQLATVVQPAPVPRESHHTSVAASLPPPVVSGPFVDAHALQADSTMLASHTVGGQLPAHTRMSTHSTDNVESAVWQAPLLTTLSPASSIGLPRASMSSLFAGLNRRAVQRLKQSKAQAQAQRKAGTV